MSDGYDLLKREWIPVLFTDGLNKEVSLLEAMVRASDIAEIVGEHPAVTLSLTRLLAAIAARAGCKDSYDPILVQRYLDARPSCFRLFDDERPFMQTPGLVTRAKGGDSTKPPSFIAFNRTSGNNVLLFDHTVDKDSTMSPAECARWLVATQSYTIQTGRSPTQDPSVTDYVTQAFLTRGACFFPQGRTLDQTLSLNLPQTSASDKACWEISADQPNSRRNFRGQVDAITSPSRCIRLIQSDDGLVRSLHSTQGPRYGEFVDYMWLPVESSDKDKKNYFKYFSDCALPSSALRVLPEAMGYFDKLRQAEGLRVIGIASKNAKALIAVSEFIPLGQHSQKSLDLSVKAIAAAKILRPTIYGKAVEVCGGDISAAPAKATLAETTFWFEITKHLADDSPSESIVMDAAKVAAISAIGVIPYSLQDRINAPLVDSKNVPAKKEQKQKSRKREMDESSIAKRLKVPVKKIRALELAKILERGQHGFISSRTIEAARVVKSKAAAPTDDQRHVVRSLIALSMARRGSTSLSNQDVVDVSQKGMKQGGSLPWATGALLEVVQRKIPHNDSISLCKALSGCRNSEAVMRSLMSSQSKSEIVDAISGALSVIPGGRISLLRLAADLSEWEKTPALTRYRWALEYLSANQGKA